jgi:hypothetical protein
MVIALRNLEGNLATGDPTMPAIFTPRHAKVVVDADGIHVVEDGERVSVPMQFCDGSLQDEAAARAYFDRSARLQDAWRGPDRATTSTLDHIKRKQQLSEAWKHDAAGVGPYGVTPREKPDAETAYAGLKQRLAEAWRAPPVVEQPWLKVQPRKYKPGLASYDPGDAVATFDDDAQTRRDQAQQRYVDRIRDAWKG